MELALAIFNVGVGIGVLTAGVSLAYLAWRTTPLIRESRALTTDLRRLARLTQQELKPILASAREVSGNVEVLSEDVAVKLDRLGQILSDLQATLEQGRPAAVIGRAPAWSVESAHDTRQHEGDG
jgi:ABC-type transport system involved in cytochrome bd biosynthesis fused ATPase/permease subunit